MPFFVVPPGGNIRMNASHMLCSRRGGVYLHPHPSGEDKLRPYA